MNPKNAKLVPSEAWLRRVASEEDSVASISVGGLVNRLQLNQVADDLQPTVFGELVRLIRRKEGLTTEQLAVQAGIDIEDLKLVEQGIVYDRNLVEKLADTLRLSCDKLTQLAGLDTPIDPELQAAARRFESRLHSITAISPFEESALNEIIQTIGG